MTIWEHAYTQVNITANTVSHASTVFLNVTSVNAIQQHVNGKYCTETADEKHEI